ncbi:hypothetical protein BaRGS_00007745, partial [Batillaria attramentaria]
SSAFNVTAFLIIPERLALELDEYVHAPSDRLKKPSPSRTVYTRMKLYRTVRIYVRPTTGPHQQTPATNMPGFFSPCQPTKPHMDPMVPKRRIPKVIKLPHYQRLPFPFPSQPSQKL